MISEFERIVNDKDSNDYEVINFSGIFYVILKKKSLKKIFFIC